MHVTVDSELHNAWDRVVSEAYELRYDCNTRSLLQNMKIYNTRDSLTLGPTFSGKHSSSNLSTSVLPDFQRLNNCQKKQFRKSHAKPLFVHAEIQLLVLFEQMRIQPTNGCSIYDYLGCSKKTCSLCGMMLKAFNSFRTRPTHAKVFSSWTVPPTKDLPLSLVFKLKSKIFELEYGMVDGFAKSLTSPSLDEVAESSLGFSEHSESSQHLACLRSLELQTRAEQNSNRIVLYKDPPEVRLGKLRRSLMGLRVPADCRIPLEIVRLETRLLKVKLLT